MGVKWAYYNEIDGFAASWLRELIKAGLIADGEVDERSIADVQPEDVRGFTQCHFFAGIGGWSYALRLAGWPDDKPVWTGSSPCTPHSSAARGRRVALDLWPPFQRLIAGVRPRAVFGEQIASRAWFDCVCDDLELLDYAIGAAVLPAYGVNLDHARPRLFFVGDTDRYSEPVGAINGKVGWMSRDRSVAGSVGASNGLSRDMVALSGFGNAIVPQVAAAFIGAYLDIERERGR